MLNRGLTSIFWPQGLGGMTVLRKSLAAGDRGCQGGPQSIKHTKSISILYWI